MELKKEFRLIEYPGKHCWILYHFYVCPDTGIEFTDAALDHINIQQVQEQLHYRRTEN